MKELGSESQEFLGEDIVDGVDDEMDLISDGPEAEEPEPALDPETGISLGEAGIPGVRIDREREEKEEE